MYSVVKLKTSTLVCVAVETAIVPQLWPSAKCNPSFIRKSNFFNETHKETHPSFMQQHTNESAENIKSGYTQFMSKCRASKRREKKCGNPNVDPRSGCVQKMEEGRNAGRGRCASTFKNHERKRNIWCILFRYIATPVCIRPAPRSRDVSYRVRIRARTTQEKSLSTFALVFHRAFSV